MCLSVVGDPYLDVFLCEHSHQLLLVAAQVEAVRKGTTFLAKAILSAPATKGVRNNQLSIVLCVWPCILVSVQHHVH